VYFERIEGQNKAFQVRQAQVTETQGDPAKGRR
jgi:hypothetical protein